MIFKQFYEPSLGHASYLPGSEDTGEALVLDVRRDVDDYYDFARVQGLRIAYAADTHQHNDYLTGITRLESRAPLELLSGARAELGYGTHPLEDGERLSMGEIEFETLHTPGHTPEHISLLVRDRNRGEVPSGIPRPLCFASSERDEMIAHHAVLSMIQITTAYRVAFPIATSSRNSQKRTRMIPATKVSASPPIGAQASSRDQTP